MLLMLKKFNSLNLVRKTWIFVSGMGYVNWRVVLVGNVGGLWIANWVGRWRVNGEVPGIEV